MEFLNKWISTSVIFPVLFHVMLCDEFCCQVLDDVGDVIVIEFWDGDGVVVDEGCVVDAGDVIVKYGLRAM